MATFTIEGVEYQLVSLDQIEELELGELEVLDEVGGLDLASLTDNEGFQVTTRVLLALVLVSMRREKPDATVDDARKVKLSVLSALAGDVANTEGAVPPTAPAASGLPA